MVRLRHARQEPYNLILVDWKMPEMDGLETTRQLRDALGHESAIIILTSYNWDDVADEALRAGVDTFVPKPLFAETVMDEFREAFRKKKGAAAAAENRPQGPQDPPGGGRGDQRRDHDHGPVHAGDGGRPYRNGEIAVQMFRDHDPGYYDAILMDMRMPDMNGLEATRAIREMDRADAGTIPIIALTANAFDEDVQRSMQAGLNAHLSKPVEPDNLYQTLENLIRD